MNANSQQDQLFLNRLTSIVEANLNNENFGVSNLAREMNISRSNLYFKVKAATGKSVSSFIRDIRLHNAKELLQKSNKTISEVAYEVGFGSPTYFSHCFHELFGSTPGEVRKIKPAAGIENDIAETTESQPVKTQRIYRTIFLSALVFIVLFLGGWFGVSRMNGPEQNELSIVVLPFKNLSDDDANQYFADGITEDILNNLYWITSLRVVSRTSSELVQNSELTVREIAKQLGVRYILEGSVRKYADKVRINVQLIDAKDDDHLWSDYYDRQIDNVIDVQGKIALQVANKLKMVLSESEVINIEKIETRNAKAYDYYLQARFLLHQANSIQRTGFTAEGVKNSIPYYEKAIAEDSTFAEAYAGLANASMQLSAWGIIRSRDGFMRSYEFSKKAIELDPECAEAYAILGAFLVWAKRDISKGGETLLKSIELNPNFATARQWYAQYLMITGPVSESRHQVNRAVELEPYFWVVKNLDAWIAYFEKDYNRSLVVTEEAHSFNPAFASNLWLFFLNYVKLNRDEEARDMLKNIVTRFSNNTVDTLEIDAVFMAKGMPGLFNWMIALNKNHPIRVEGLNGDYFYLAWWYAILGDADQTVYWLEQNLTYKRPNYHFFNLIINHPDFEFLHNDPRFAEVVKKLGLEEYWPKEPV